MRPTPPRRFPNEITVDARSTGISLKRRIAARLRAHASVTGWPPARAIQADVLRMRRSSRGAHISCESETTQIGEGGLGLGDGDVIFVERGAPLHAAEVLVRCCWCIPDELSLSDESTGGRHASPPATATGEEDHAPEERRRKSRTVSWATASEVSVLGEDEPELASYGSSSISSRVRCPSIEVHAIFSDMRFVVRRRHPLDRARHARARARSHRRLPTRVVLGTALLTARMKMVAMSRKMRGSRWIPLRAECRCSRVLQVNTHEAQ